MKVDGSCQCGKITFEANVDPGNSYICNCTDCQTLAGSAFRWFLTTPESDFRLLTGVPKVFVKVRDDDSTANHQDFFCADCGSPIYSTTPPGDEARFFNVRVPTLKQRNDLQPQIQYWKSSALDWLAEVDLIKEEGGDTA